MTSIPIIFIWDVYILRFADTAAILILPPGHPIMIIEINCSQRNILIPVIIMGCPGGKINMAAVSAKWSMVRPLDINHIIFLATSLSNWPGVFLWKLPYGRNFRCSYLAKTTKVDKL